jgi:protein O-mannosyl-transferase
MSNRKISSHERDSQALSRTSVPTALPLSVLAGAAVIVIVVFLAYFPSTNGGFVLDDDLMITENNNIKAADGLYRLWCTEKEQDYWPMTYSTFWLEWRMWDRRPTGYHVSNLLLHIVETLLIWLILRRLSIPGAFLAAVIFAVHPVNVESVAWIAQRKNTMTMLFFLLSILCYLKHLCNRRAPCAIPAYGMCGLLSGRWYWLSFAAFILAMFSKGSVAVLPVLLLGIVWWLRPLTRWDLIRTAPFFAVAVALAAVNVRFQTHGTDLVFRTASITERLLGAGCAVWFYLYKAFLPVDLYFVYPLWHIQAGKLQWWLPLSAALIVTAVLWRYRKGWSRPFLFAWGFFCVALVPVAGFIDVGFMRYSLVADRYQHIAIIAVIALAASGWKVWHRRMHGGTYWAGTAVVVMAVGSLIFLTWRQNGIYRDAFTLYYAALEKNANCCLIHNNLGYLLAQAGKPKEAIDHLRQAVRINPDYPSAQYNLGNLLQGDGRLDEAIEHFQQVLRTNPDCAEAHNNLGVSLADTKRPREAIEHFRQAVHINPEYLAAQYNLGNVLLKTGQVQEAVEQYRQVLRLKPDYLDAHIDLGNALFKTGRLQEAIEQYQKVLALKSDSAEVYNNMALVYASLRQSSEAQAAARKALALAQSNKKTALAKQIEDWLNAYRASLTNLPETPPAN